MKKTPSVELQEVVRAVFAVTEACSLAIHDRFPFAISTELPPALKDSLVVGEWAVFVESLNPAAVQRFKLYSKALESFHRTWEQFNGASGVERRKRERELRSVSLALLEDAPLILEICRLPPEVEEVTEEAGGWR